MFLGNVIYSACMPFSSIVLIVFAATNTWPKLICSLAARLWAVETTTLVPVVLLTLRPALTLEDVVDVMVIPLLILATVAAVPLPIDKVVWLVWALALLVIGITLERTPSLNVTPGSP